MHLVMYEGVNAALKISHFSLSPDELKVSVVMALVVLQQVLHGCTVCGCTVCRVMALVVLCYGCDAIALDPM